MPVNNGMENYLNINQVDYVVEGSNTPLPTITAKEASEAEKQMAGHIVKPVSYTHLSPHDKIQLAARAADML